MSERLSDDLLDGAIDDVARELTALPPRHGFAARVRARIDTPRRARPWVWQIAAAAAVLALAVYVFRPVPPAEPPATVVTGRVETQTPAVPPAVAARQPERVAVPRARQVGSRTSPGRRQRIAVEDEAVQLAALSEVVPLSLAIDEPRELAATTIEVDPLSISPLNPDSDKEPR